MGFDIHTNETPIAILHRSNQQKAAAIIIWEGSGINEQNNPTKTALAALFLLKWKRSRFFNKCWIGFNAGLLITDCGSGKYFFKNEFFISPHLTSNTAVFFFAKT